jgi:hypothetical protein
VKFFYRFLRDIEISEYLEGDVARYLINLPGERENVMKLRGSSNGDSAQHNDDAQRRNSPAITSVMHFGSNH